MAALTGKLRFDVLLRKEGSTDEPVLVGHVEVSLDDLGAPKPLPEPVPPLPSPTKPKDV